MTRYLALAAIVVAPALMYGRRLDDAQLHGRDGWNYSSSKVDFIGD